MTAELAGEPVVLHSLRAFEACASVERIVLVTREDRRAEFEAMARGITKLAAVVAGGAERHLSVWNGIRAASARADDFLAVHDAARPLVTPAMIDACLADARQHGAAACAVPVADTLKRADAQRMAVGSVERDGLWAMQTPQIVRTDILERAYRELIASDALVTDEVSAVQRLGLPVAFTRIDEPNFKITLPRDLELARLVLESR